jgi:hypothetical protein
LTAGWLQLARGVLGPLLSVIRVTLAERPPQQQQRAPPSLCQLVIRVASAELELKQMVLGEGRPHQQALLQQQWARTALQQQLRLLLVHLVLLLLVQQLASRERQMALRQGPLCPAGACLAPVLLGPQVQLPARLQHRRALLARAAVVVVLPGAARVMVLLQHGQRLLWAVLVSAAWVLCLKVGMPASLSSSSRICCQCYATSRRLQQQANRTLRLLLRRCQKGCLLNSRTAVRLTCWWASFALAGAAAAATVVTHLLGGHQPCRCVGVLHQ